MRETKKNYYAYRSFWPELEARKMFRERIGVNIHNVMISNTANSLGFPYTKYPPVWKWNGVYDLEAFDRQLDDVIANVPDARFLCMLDLNTPHWWTRYLGAFGVRYDSFYELGKISASELWRKDTTEYMQTVMRHAQEKYGDRIEAYVLGCGGATEWHDRSRCEESIYRLDAFRKWQKEHGLPQTDIPGRMRRDSGSYDFCNDYSDPESYYNGNDPTGGAYQEIFPQKYGLFRTPEKDQDVLDYLRFCAEFNADTLGYFLAEARKVLPPQVELGSFFGYCFSAWTMHAGHLAYERLLSNPDLDFVIAPTINYTLGSGSVSATIHETVKLHGKQMLQEFDQKIWCYNRVMSDCCTLAAPAVNTEEVKWNEKGSGKDIAKTFTFGNGNGWDNPHRSAECIKRDSSMALINRDSLWWFDMWGGFYQHEEVLKALEESRRIYGEQIEISTDPVAEILVVVDPENMLLLNSLNERCGTFHTKPISMLGKSGLPYQVCSFNDLGKLPLERYRLVVLCHPFFLPPEKLAFIRSKLMNSGRTILWVYGPVIDENGKWNPDNSEKICGIPYQAPDLPVKNMGSWTSAYVFRPEKVLTENNLRELALQAGCHAWCSRARPIFANSRFLCVHTALAEELKLHLPFEAANITELYTGQQWHHTSEIALKTDSEQTYMFKYSKE